ncbi:Translation factor waclaw, mitochondrial [Pseudolycoriella hygida]|uniref:Translation factor GUF1 homolog, mitochondrial n=1 Tax=Pseudolycoriella hygida TaxID=35572 RepID=A0A9Q0NFV6_9DIPT|nr:Translation factor waclaw, mitochondrial [Pseudolycoriella hygida]
MIIKRLVSRYLKPYFWKSEQNWLRLCRCQHYSTNKEIEEYLNIPVEQVRNFSIIAHVDHGKSTLADRLLELTGAVKKNSGKSQILDSLQVEQERGITVKAQTASLLYDYKDKRYLLNLIDTPGHVDFCNEVYRSLAACEGVVLLVDANQGVQAQTVANFHLAKSKDLTIVPVLNKVDLKNADPDRVCLELLTLFSIDPDTVLRISAKFGTGVENVLQEVIERIPHPQADRSKHFRGLLFDSWYEQYRGTLNLIYLKDGQLNVGDEITSHLTNKSYEVKSLSILTPAETPIHQLVAGQVGLVGCNMKNSKESIIGDTLHLKNVKVEPLTGFKPQQPMVFAGVYPADQAQHVALRTAIEKLILTDSAVTLTPDSSPALGQGWRLGFLGLLHMEVFCQRLEQEHGAEPIITAPSVTYKLKLKNPKLISTYGEHTIYLSNPTHFPNEKDVEEYFEPCVKGTIVTPTEYLGDVIALCVNKRGVQQSCSNIDDLRIMIKYFLPLSEIVLDFHDKLKAVSSGYASFDYEPLGYHSTDIVKLNIHLNGNPVEELSRIVHKTKVNSVARDIAFRLKETIPRQMIQIAIQACVGSKVLARETIKAYRKDVTAKLYGGDVTRRMKLLKQQAEGKKKMRSIANVRIPHETFISVLRK